MGKVKGEDKFPNELVSQRRRKKQKKELDILRRNVLEAKRKLREKTAPPKTHTSTFNKILNSFADRRQANDNKTQGFDNKGKKAGLKKICNRLLPSRKPQVGIFANGAKGAEIKRVDLSLSESDRARYDGDLQKVLCDGKRKCKESRSDVLNEILHKPSVKAVDMAAQEFIQNPERKLERKPVQNFITERQSGKRKLQVPIELEGKAAKKPHSEVEEAKVKVQCDKVKSEWKNSKEKRWKKSLFQNEVDYFEPIVEPGFEQLRFSPIIGRAKVQPIPTEPKELPTINDENPNNNMLNFNYEQLGRQAAAKYEELCSMVCARNFDTCLQEIPHIDPLIKVKQSLMNFYTETCNQKALQNKVKREVLFAEESSSTSSRIVHSNIDEAKYFDLRNEYLERSKSDRMNVSPVPGVCLNNLKNFGHQESTETSSVRSRPPTMEAREVNKSKDVSSSETRIIERNSSSLDVNYDSPRKSFRSDVLESLKIDDEAGPSVSELNSCASPRFSGIPSHRKKTMLRYLKEVNNFEPPVKDSAICPIELSATFAENNDVQKKCDIGGPLKRHKIQMKPTVNVPELRRLPSETNIAEQPRNSSDVDYHGVRTRLGLDSGNLPKIDQGARPTVVNLGSASRSTLARIPSDRREFMLRYLQDVNNSEPREVDGATLRPVVFLAVPKDTKQLFDPLRIHEAKNLPVDRLSKNERHVPAILRKSQAAKKNKKSKTVDTILGKGVLGVVNRRCKTSNFEFNNKKMPSDSETRTVNSLPDKRESSRKLPPSEYSFSIDSHNSSNPEWSYLAKGGSQTSFYHHDGPPQPETPEIVNALYDLNKKALNVKRNFMDGLFLHKPGQQNIAKPSEGVNFPADLNPESPEICCRVKYTDNPATSNFHSRRPQNAPILLQQQRPDSMVHRSEYDESVMSSLGNHGWQRFPVYLKRKAASATQNKVSFKGQYQLDHLHPEKVIIQSPNLQAISQQNGKHEMNLPYMTYKNEDQSLQANDAELSFLKYPRGVQTALRKPVQIRHGRQKTQQLQVADSSIHNVGVQVGQPQIPRCKCKDVMQDEHHVRLPGIVYQNGMQKVVNREYRVQELVNNPVNFFEPTTFDVPTSQTMFQPHVSSNAEMPASATYGSSYCGNTNFQSQLQGCSSAEPVKFFNRRVGYVLPKNDQELFCQNATDLPIITQQITSRQNHSPVLSEDKNHSYKYIIDPRYPQAGYQWNQIDQNGGQIDQRIIQPAYNVTDAYRPQVPHSYFSTDS